MQNIKFALLVVSLFIMQTSCKTSSNNAGTVSNAELNDSKEKDLAQIEIQIQNNYRKSIVGPFGGGIVSRISELAKQLEIAPSENLAGTLANIENKLGVPTDEKAGMLPRLDKVQNMYVEDKVAELFENEYGIPGRMTVEQRIVAAEKNFDTLKGIALPAATTFAARVSRAISIVPEATSDSGTINRKLTALETYFKLPALSKATDEQRMNRIDPLVLNVYKSKLNDGRKKMNLEDRIKTLKKNFEVP